MLAMSMAPSSEHPTAHYSVNGQHGTIPQLPKPPSPSKDPRVSLEKPSGDGAEVALPPFQELDIDTLSAVAALKMLCKMVERLVEITGDVPPTPAINKLGKPNLGVILQEKENVARHKEAVRQSRNSSPNPPDDHEDVPPRAKTPIGSPEARPTEPLHVGDPEVAPLNLQHGVIVRKFYSKKAPAISLEEYLMRVHQYCPMTTGVYLATSLYIHRLAVIERIIPVTARNAHRLVLAGLRVSMKKLEDFRYSHSRFAKVGGVSEAELGKLEVSFCFLTSFDLKANKEMLSAHAMAIGDNSFTFPDLSEFSISLPTIKKPVQGVHRMSPVPVASFETPAVA